MRHENDNANRFEQYPKRHWFLHGPSHPLNLKNANRYAYAANNPLNLSDPSGLGFWSDFGSTFARTIAGGTILLLGVALGGALDTTGDGLAVAAGGGCAAGLISTLVGESITAINPA